MVKLANIQVLDQSDEYFIVKGLFDMPDILRQRIPFIFDYWERQVISLEIPLALLLAQLQRINFSFQTLQPQPRHYSTLSSPSL